MIKFLSFFRDLLNFNIFNNSYYRKLITEFIIENQIKKNYQELIISNLIYQKINLLNKLTIEKLNKKNIIVEKNISY